MIVECSWQDLYRRAQQRGYEAAEVIPCIVERKGMKIVVDTSHASYPMTKRRGPGSALKVILRKLGHTYSPGCKCRDRVKQMNAWGPDKCEENIDIIEKWISAEARKKKVPYLPILGKTLISLSIKRSRRRSSDGKAKAK